MVNENDNEIEEFELGPGEYIFTKGRKAAENVRLRLAFRGDLELEMVSAVDRAFPYKLNIKNEPEFLDDRTRACFAFVNDIRDPRLSNTRDFLESIQAFATVTVKKATDHETTEIDPELYRKRTGGSYTSALIDRTEDSATKLLERGKLSPVELLAQAGGIIQELKAQNNGLTELYPTDRELASLAKESNRYLDIMAEILEDSRIPIIARNCAKNEQDTLILPR